LPVTAFLLIVLAAFAHSAWNLLAKRTAHSKHLIWFSSVAESLLFLPLAVWVLADSRSTLSLKAIAFLFGTGVLHLLYTESLLRGYRAGDLSVVYPLARGAGPLLSFAGAIVVLGERPSALAGAAAVMVTSGVLLLAGGMSAFRNRAGRAGLWWGVATGFTIACYTLVDGYSVKTLLLSPLHAGNVHDDRRVFWRQVSWRRTCRAARVGIRDDCGWRGGSGFRLEHLDQFVFTGAEQRFSDDCLLHV
jgi:uncharacterized membrane protein